MNYATAYAALIIMGGLRPGNQVLIHAAAGGVGIAAPRSPGIPALRSSVPPRGPSMRPFAHGVRHAIDYRTEDFAAEVRRLTDGVGVDLIIDPMGPTSFRKDYRILASRRPTDHVRTVRSHGRARQTFGRRFRRCSGCPPPPCLGGTAHGC